MAGETKNNDFLGLIAAQIAERVYEQFAEKMAQPAEPLVYSVEQAALKLGLSLSTLKEMVRQREIVVVRRGSRVLIPRKSLEEWIERNAA